MLRLCIWIFMLLLMLSGCDKVPDSKEICETMPHLCKNLHTDGWCRYERTQVVYARYFYDKKVDDFNKYNLLKRLDAYQKCVELTTHIEYKRDSANARKNDRVRGAASARTQLLKLQEDVKNDNGPFMLMWRWLQMGDNSARRQFLAMEGTPALKHPELQVALAGYYANRDKDKAIQLLHYSLSLRTEEDEIGQQVPPALASLYMDTKQFEKALLWAYVTQMLVEDGSSVKPEQIAIYASIDKDKQEDAQDKAEDIVDAIMDAEYVDPNAKPKKK